MPKSLVIKNQYSLNYRLKKKKLDGCVESEVEFTAGPKIKNSQNEVTYISFRGIKIDVGSVVMIMCGTSGTQKFYMVQKILLESSAFSIVDEKLTVEYSDHYDSYRVVMNANPKKVRKITGRYKTLFLRHVHDSFEL